VSARAASGSRQADGPRWGPASGAEIVGAACAGVGLTGSSPSRSPRLVWRTMPGGVYRDSVEWRITLTPEGDRTRVRESFEVIRLAKAVELLMGVVMSGEIPARNRHDVVVRRNAANGQMLARSPKLPAMTSATMVQPYYPRLESKTRVACSIPASRAPSTGCNPLLSVMGRAQDNCGDRAHRARIASRFGRDRGAANPQISLEEAFRPR
jgi:hypothetical protein